MAPELGDADAPAAARIKDLPAKFRSSVQGLDSAYQARFLAWIPLIVSRLEDRPTLFETLMALVRSGRASCVEEWELALAFTAWALDPRAANDGDIASTLADASYEEATARLAWTDETLKYGRMTMVR